MLVRIEPQDVEIGMFVHAFEGSWFDHPFWRRYFRIETQEQLDRIRNLAIEGLLIDDQLGIGPRAASQATEPEKSPGPRRKRVARGKDRAGALERHALI